MYELVGNSRKTAAEQARNTRCCWNICSPRTPPTPFGQVVGFRSYTGMTSKTRSIPRVQVQVHDLSQLPQWKSASCVFVSRTNYILTAGVPGANKQWIKNSCYAELGSAPYSEELWKSSLRSDEHSNLSLVWCHQADGVQNSHFALWHFGITRQAAFCQSWYCFVIQYPRGHMVQFCVHMLVFFMQFRMCPRWFI